MGRAERRSDVGNDIDIVIERVFCVLNVFGLLNVFTF